MSIPLNSRKKIIYYLAATFGSVVLMLLVVIINERSNNPRRINDRLEHYVHLVEDKMDKTIDEVKSLVKAAGINELVIDELKNYENTNTEATLFIFEDKNLIYWSGNSVRVPETLQIHDGMTRFEHLGNGWYLTRHYKEGSFAILVAYRLKYEYAFENDYLKSRFTGRLNIPDNLTANITETEYKIISRDGNYLFSLNFSGQKALSDISHLMLALLYILSYIFLLLLVYQLWEGLTFHFNRKNLFYSLLIFDLIIIRILIFVLPYPSVVYTSPLFSPAFFASSLLIPSLGDLLLHVLTLLLVAYVLYKKLKLPQQTQKSNLVNNLLTFIGLITFNTIIFLWVDESLRSIIKNSGISFNLIDISSIDSYSIIGFLCFGLLSISFVLISRKTVILARKCMRSYFSYLLGSLLILLLGYSILFLYDYDGLVLLFLFLYFATFTSSSDQKDIPLSFLNALVLIVIFSLFSNYILFLENELKEKENRKILARTLAEYKDPIAEHKFASVSDSIRYDPFISVYLEKFPFSDDSDLNAAADYIIHNFFTHYWLKYDLLITICDEKRTLTFRPGDVTVNCRQYFEDLISSFGNPTRSENFYFIDDGFLEKYYLGILEYPAEKGILNIYIEFYPKNMPKGLGYPELLMDSRKGNEVNWSDYSYARYFDGELFFRFGKYYFAMNLDHYMPRPKEAHYIEKDGYSHYILPVEEKSALIVSLKNPGFFDIVAPFSYISIFYGLLSLILFLLIKGPSGLRMINQGFRQRLQLSVTTLILSSFFLVGIGSIAFIISLNNKKNYANLSEKAHSVLIELEHKIAGVESIYPEMETYISDLLYKFSLVFFTDINLYYPDGNLLSTSRPEIFNRGFISDRMNAKAFRELHIDNRSLIIQSEHIGEYNYLSAYVPLRNVNNDLIAYLNLPYFARQDELTKEISAFLVAFINIYIILIAIAIYFALIISNYISKPVHMLKEKLRTLKIGNTEEKIEWNKGDEIGDLVAEYNRMVDEIARSAKLLAKSERESAWREMARQIAHEIKNPLTPMKLSVQYLQKAWDEKLPGWEERLNNFSKTIVEQIDSLSVIATAFSDFANMPRSKFQKTELKEIAQNAIGLFKDSTSVKFNLESAGMHYVWGDKEQLLRMFNNLIKNSVQAIPEPDTGEVHIHIFSEGGLHRIVFSDNGNGIPRAQQEKVFSPNFTTKSGGMGLGLAMVKNIVTNAGGDITFDSDEGEGTTFYISLPIYNPEQTEEELSRE